MVDVERWAELRREHFVCQVSIRELARRYGVDRNTVRRALRSEQPPVYRRAPKPSKLDPFKDEVHELLRRDPKLSGVRVRELIEPLGFEGTKSIVDDYLREVRPLFAKPFRDFQSGCPSLPIPEAAPRRPRLLAAQPSTGHNKSVPARRLEAGQPSRGDRVLTRAGEE